MRVVLADDLMQECDFEYQVKSYVHTLHSHLLDMIISGDYEDSVMSSRKDVGMIVSGFEPIRLKLYRMINDMMV